MSVDDISMFKPDVNQQQEVSHEVTDAKLDDAVKSVEGMRAQLNSYVSKDASSPEGAEAKPQDSGFIGGLMNMLDGIYNGLCDFFKGLFGVSEPTLQTEDPKVADLAHRLDLEIADLKQLQSIKNSAGDAANALRVSGAEAQGASPELAAEIKGMHQEITGMHTTIDHLASRMAAARHGASEHLHQDHGVHAAISAHVGTLAHGSEKSLLPDEKIDYTTDDGKHSNQSGGSYRNGEPDNGPAGAALNDMGGNRTASRAEANRPTQSGDAAAAGSAADSNQMQLDPGTNGDVQGDPETEDPVAMNAEGEEVNRDGDVVGEDVRPDSGTRYDTRTGVVTPLIIDPFPGPVILVPEAGRLHHDPHHHPGHDPAPVLGRGTHEPIGVPTHGPEHVPHPIEGPHPGHPTHGPEHLPVPHPIEGTHPVHPIGGPERLPHPIEGTHPVHPIGGPERLPHPIEGTHPVHPIGGPERLPHPIDGIHPGPIGSPVHIPEPVHVNPPIHIPEPVHVNPPIHIPEPVHVNPPIHIPEPVNVAPPTPPIHIPEPVHAAPPPPPIHIPEPVHTAPPPPVHVDPPPPVHVDPPPPVHQAPPPPPPVHTAPPPPPVHTSPPPPPPSGGGRRFGR